MKGIIFKTKKSLIELGNFPGYQLKIIDDIVYHELDEWMNDIVKSIENSCVNIFIPLCFGSILSDYLGLRLAVHFRTSMTKNILSNIYLYGTESIETVLSNEYSLIFKTKGVFLIDYNLSVLQKYAETKDVILDKSELINELDKLQLKVPGNLYDNHSVANIWGMYRLLELEGINPTLIKSLSIKKNNLNNIYLKWLLAKNSNLKLITSEVQTVRAEYHERLAGPKILGKIDLSKFKK
jgi:hypothetical protein